MSRSYWGFDVGQGIVLGTSHGGESARCQVLFNQGVLLVPLVAEPAIKCFGIIKRYVGDTEPAPVEVDRFGWSALKVCARQAKVVFSILPPPIQPLSAKIVTA